MQSWTFSLPHHSRHLLSPLFESVVVAIFTAFLIVSWLDRLKGKCKTAYKNTKNALEDEVKVIKRNDIDIILPFLVQTSK